MQLVRAARDLESTGLLRRITEPHRNRTTHVIPSIQLLQQTIEKLNGHANVAAICSGLRQTHWGHELALRLERSDDSSFPGPARGEGIVPTGTVPATKRHHG
jgi:hypothetical protein